MGYITAVIILLIIANYIVFARRKRLARKKLHPLTKAQEAEQRLRDVKSRFEYEQEEAARYVELRGKTFELYEQVRKQHEAQD